MAVSGVNTSFLHSIFELLGCTFSTAAQCGFCLIFILIKKKNLLGTLNEQGEGNVPPAGHLHVLI